MLRCRSTVRRLQSVIARQLSVSTSIAPKTTKISVSTPNFHTVSLNTKVQPIAFNIRTMSTTQSKSVARLVDIPVDELANKVVFVRVDYNVTMEETAPGQYQVKKSSYKRIVESLPTLRHLLDAGAKIVLASHLGDPVDNDPSLSLAPVGPVLTELLGCKVAVAKTSVGDEVKALAGSLEAGSILLLENLRYSKAEKKNDPKFVSGLIDSTGLDIYVNDAFGTAHRKHASVVGVPEEIRRRNLDGWPTGEFKKVPCVSGMLMGKEVKYLSEVFPESNNKNNTNTNAKQIAAVLGGAKVSSKLPVFKNLIPKVDMLIIGGAMALPFIKANGVDITGVDAEAVDAASQVLSLAKDAGVRVILPVDFNTATKLEDSAVSGEASIVYDTAALPAGVFSLDIGPKSTQLFCDELAKCSVVVWNGPLGKFEWAEYAKSTMAVVEALSAMPDVVTVVGGGETAQCIELAKDQGIDVKITHVSTGGGASLEMLQGIELPAIAALDTK